MTITVGPEFSAHRETILNAPRPRAIAAPAGTAAAGRSARFLRWGRQAALGDLTAAAIAGATATAATQRWGTAELRSSPELIGLAVVVLWPALLGLGGAYSLKASLSSVEEVRRLLEGGVRFLAGLGAAHICLGLDLPATYVAVLLLTTVLLSTTGRVVIRSNLGRSNADWHSYRVVAVGPLRDILRFCGDLEHSRNTQIQVVAYVADDLADGPVPVELRSFRRLPSRSALRGMADDGIDADVLVRVGRPEPDEMWTLGQRAYDAGMTVAIAPSRDDATTAMATTYVPLGPTPLLVVETPTLRPVAALSKSIFDRLVALVLIVLLSPLFVGIAAAIAIRDGRPVLFRQQRVGRGGRRFTCFKFRTMAPDAEQQLEELRDLNQGCGPLFKLREDPRVTPTGRWLRQRSLDELPQLFNVLRGDMSIVGPRPPIPAEVETYDVRTARRLLVKPGITGLWQTQGRSDLPWDESICLDLMYIDHWSPVLDLVTLVRTVKTVARPTGAY